MASYTCYMRSIKENTLIFETSQTTDRQSIFAELSKKYQIVKDPLLKSRIIYLDTFDWRLYNENLLLIKEQERFILKKKNTLAEICSLSAPRAQSPAFWWDFEQSSLKNALRSVLDLRALIQIVSIQKTIQPYRLLNKDEKTVIRANFELVRPAGRASHGLTTMQLLLIMPLRGYENELKHIEEPLKTAGLEQSKSDYFDLLVNKSGRIPSDYSSKLNINLQPHISSKDALTVILKNLLSTIRKNEDGIKQDIDTEFLHDFRVAVRRTRSALSLIKGVFNKQALSSHKTGISRLGKATNALRDLDVYLLKQEEYKDLVPQDLHPGLELIFEKISEQRKTELAKLKRFLNSKAYKNIVAEWESFLDTYEDNSPESENAGTDILVLAKRIINKKYRQIIKTGRAIDGSTPDEQLHRLRIECKKLRYMLEFFSSLFPKNEIGLIIKNLKKLQDNLGDFNDLCVQQQSLKEFAEKFDSDDKNITISIGGLIAVLYQKQNETRNKFTSTFKRFTADENTRLFNKLFSPRK
ncbi:MAG: CHAD domain-containing protein [Candidatus Dadabacteria bacterium]|nr:CHAD domain-containing protein [Candidatus Dadabacteria bacterium]